MTEWVLAVFFVAWQVSDPKCPYPGFMSDDTHMKNEMYQRLEIVWACG